MNFAKHKTLFLRIINLFYIDIQRLYFKNKSRFLSRIMNLLNLILYLT